MRRDEVANALVPTPASARHAPRQGNVILCEVAPVVRRATRHAVAAAQLEYEWAPYVPRGTTHGLADRCGSIVLIAPRNEPELVDIHLVLALVHIHHRRHHLIAVCMEVISTERQVQQHVRVLRVRIAVRRILMSWIVLVVPRLSRDPAVRMHIDAHGGTVLEVGASLKRVGEGVLNGATRYDNGVIVPEVRGRAAIMSHQHLLHVVRIEVRLVAMEHAVGCHSSHGHAAKLQSLQHVIVRDLVADALHAQQRVEALRVELSLRVHDLVQLLFPVVVRDLAPGGT
mmetsp:Transcript_113928/g.276656  ORF Transcript_113928/g.276656 Transcript_113928/m.276656 type:complete len:285 (-) Transcript_113928:193-1047(-)